MNERLEQARQLGRRIDAGWQPADVEAQLARLHARRARRWMVPAPLVAAAAAAAIVVGVLRPRAGDVAVASAGDRTDRIHPTTPQPPVAVVPAPAVEPAPAPVPAIADAPAAPGVLSLGDGSVVTPLGQGSRLVARRVSDTDVVVVLAGGGARFDVPERKARRFRAELGALALETHGAAFRVQVGRRPGQVEVAAERGEVSAHVGQDAHVVAAGQTRAFSIASSIAARDDAAPVARDEPPAPPAPASHWREDAARGDYAAAWAALGALRAQLDPTGASASRPAGKAVGVPTPLLASLDGMEDLQLAGDVARLSGHAGAAVAPLVRALALHADDPRAPLVAFTLGRVHLEDLGAPRDAALAFARARTLAPDGPLAEDALAREVEAWSRAGETETARVQALSYTQRYPQGRRVHAVRRFGGLESP
jgi:transmembrane sensor